VVDSNITVLGYCKRASQVTPTAMATAALTDVPSLKHMHMKFKYTALCPTYLYPLPLLQQLAAKWYTENTQLFSTC
jgi:hypothetical protein